MGHGSGQAVFARDEHGPDAPLARRRIVCTYERTAYHLQVLTLADADGRQTLRVTDEHPFYHTATAAGESADTPGWAPARPLAGRWPLAMKCSASPDVIANAGEAQRQGVKVYNLEVE